MADKQNRESPAGTGVRYYISKVIEAEANAAKTKRMARDQFLRMANAWRGLAEALSGHPDLTAGALHPALHALVEAHVKITSFAQHPFVLGGEFAPDMNHPG